MHAYADHKQLLLIGSSFSAAPLLRCLQASGYEVDTCGAYPSDPCVGWSKRHHLLDYSDPSALLDLVQRENYAAIIPTCNDYAYLSAVRVAEQLGYPGFDSLETTLVLHEKKRFRKFAAKHGLPVPKLFESIEEAAVADQRDYPLLIKPDDSFSGKGVSRIAQASELADAIVTAIKNSRSGRYVIEQFIEGSLHSHSAFLVKQEIEADFFVDEFCTVYPYQVNCSNSPSRLSEAIRERTRACIRELAHQLKLADGLLHTQFLVSGDDVYLVECMRRCPGDLYYHLINFSMGMPYIANYLRPFLGMGLRFPKPLPPHSTQYWARHTVSLAQQQIVHAFSVHLTCEEIRTFPLHLSGSRVSAAPHGKIAILFARFASADKLFSHAAQFAQSIEFHTNESLIDERIDVSQ